MNRVLQVCCVNLQVGSASSNILYPSESDKVGPFSLQVCCAQHKTYLNLRGINSSIFLGSDGLRYALDAQDGNGHVSAEHEEARSLLANFQARLFERRPRTARS